METVALVEYDVEDDGNAVTVANFNEVLKVGGRTVGFVRCHIEVGVVAPGIVAVEFHYGKQFDCIDAELFEIRNLFDGGLDGAFGISFAFCAGEVAKEELIDYEVTMVGNLEVGELIVSVEVATIDGKHGVVEFVVGILRHIGPDVFIEPFVAMVVKDETGIGVADFICGVNNIVVGIPLIVAETGDGSEEVALTVVVLILHHVFVEDIVVVPGGHDDY